MGAKTSPPVVTHAIRGPADPEPVPVRGRGFVPRRMYTRAGDYEKHGYIEGCRGCVWLRNQLGPGVGHREVCRTRLEEAIAKDPGDDRAKKAQERLDHYAAEMVEEGDERREREEGPRQEEGRRAEAIGEDVKNEPKTMPQEFDIGSPTKDVGMEDAEELND